MTDLGGRGWRGWRRLGADSRSGAGMTEMGGGNDEGWRWGLGAAHGGIPLFGPGAGSAASAGMTDLGTGVTGGRVEWEVGVWVSAAGGG